MLWNEDAEEVTQGNCKSVRRTYEAFPFFQSKSTAHSSED